MNLQAKYTISIWLHLDVIDDYNTIIHTIHFSDQSVFNEDFSLLRHRNNPHPREYLTMHVQQPHLMQNRRSSIEASNPSSKELTPPPPPPPNTSIPHEALACRQQQRQQHPALDFCTLRRHGTGQPGQRPRAVQFADQQNVRYCIVYLDTKCTVPLMYSSIIWL